MPLIAGVCLDKWAGATGYKVFFGILAVMGVVGLLASLGWMAVTKEKRKQIQAAKKAGK